MDTMIILSSAALGYAFAIGVTSLHTYVVKNKSIDTFDERFKKDMKPNMMRGYASVISTYDTVIREFKEVIENEKDAEFKSDLERALNKLEERRQYLSSNEFLETIEARPTTNLRVHYKLVNQVTEEINEALEAYKERKKAESKGV